MGQIDKLEAQNRNLAINVFAWENDEVIIHRVSKKEANVPRINLMLIQSEMKQHYCYVKKVSALLFDQTKDQHAKYFCMMCLNHFTRWTCWKVTKTLQWSEWNPDKDRDARKGEKHPFLPEPPQTDEGVLRDLCRL